MNIFIDTADIEQIKKYKEFIDGVTTNPTLIAKSKKDFKKTIIEICTLINGPVSAEVIATNHEDMVNEGIELSKIHENVVVKLPLTADGLLATKTLSKKNININATLVFSAQQALMAAKAGASYVSPFVGRLDNIGQDGMRVVEEIIAIFKNYNFKTQVLVASVRTPQHVLHAALLGAHCVTCPPAIIDQLMKHPLTDIGLKKFIEDFNNANKNI